MKARIGHTHLAKLIRPTQKYERHNNVNGTDTHTHILACVGQAYVENTRDNGTQNTQGMEDIATSMKERHALSVDLCHSHILEGLHFLLATVRAKYTRLTPKSRDQLLPICDMLY